MPFVNQTDTKIDCEGNATKWRMQMLYEKKCKIVG